MNDADKIELKNGMDNTDKIKLKNCTIIDDVVICDMEREEYKKMKNPPDALEINLEDEVPKNKSNDGTRSTEANPSNKQGCGCSITENEIANFLAKFQIKKEENSL
ncbi:MAG: hypothetical protein IH841_08410 [Thaumarchaeota archaeon]|nr:hypothetical protein [Nitrososphaerota archaeon]